MSDPVRLCTAASYSSIFSSTASFACACLSSASMYSSATSPKSSWRASAASSCSSSSLVPETRLRFSSHRSNSRMSSSNSSLISALTAGSSLIQYSPIKSLVAIRLIIISMAASAAGTCSFTIPSTLVLRLRILKMATPATTRRSSETVKYPPSIFVPILNRLNIVQPPLRNKW